MSRKRGPDGKDRQHGWKRGPIRVGFSALLLDVIAIVMSRLGGRIDVELADGAFERHRVVVHFAQQEGALRIQSLLLSGAQIQVGNSLPAGSVQGHPAALDAHSETVPPAVLDVVVEDHRAPLPDAHQDLSPQELHAELHLPFRRQGREEEGAVDPVNGQAEDQGEVGGAARRREDGAQGRLEAGPRGEDDAGLEGDDAVGDGAIARG